MAETESQVPENYRELVAHTASLARISLDEQEITHMAGQLQEILQSVEKIREIVDESVPVTSHPIPLQNVMRLDEIRDVLPQEKALQNAPDEEDGKFRVTAILGGEQ